MPPQTSTHNGRGSARRDDGAAGVELEGALELAPGALGLAHVHERSAEAGVRRVLRERDGVGRVGGRRVEQVVHGAA